MHGMRMQRVGKYTLPKFKLSSGKQASKSCHVSVQFHFKQRVQEG